MISNVTSTTATTEYTAQFALPSNVKPSMDICIDCLVLNSGWYPTTSISAYVTLNANANTIKTRISGAISSGVMRFSEMYPRNYFIIS